MKTTKKIARVAVLVMAAMMVFSFTSCNKKEKNPLKGHEYQYKQEHEGWWESDTLKFSEKEVVNVHENSEFSPEQFEGSYTINPESLTGSFYFQGQETKFSYKEDGSSVSFLGTDFKKIK